ncbi:lytic transglycosylase domain-containing protein [Lewinella sp. 4G2]|uniref:lytic transglycosylase domain-containing protein n=1 Tax=Lewinella sp. 4G2 TaxID=1803372 RepID=UPI0007B4DE71|nr:lytic transglycosylase domain-containing protein [Lewinella sp. 4G2]OAV43886.1 hypothetical protein A3850_004985 [Lewinella sp. 4G2]
MRQLLACLAFVFLFSLPSSPLAALDLFDPAASNPQTLSRQIDRRIERLGLPVATPATDAQLHRKLRDYLGGHHQTENMLGRAEAYFPIFEEIFCQYDIPTSLKYLAVAESMLKPHAQSGADAAGLWQLMPQTARAYGLRVDYLIDERLDLQKSTDAAARLLRDLHEQYGNWHLAIAAYNAGTTRVSRAIRRSGGSTNYDRVRRYLPRETRNYVGAYIAAAYTLNYYHIHGLSAAEATDATTTFNIHRRTSLRELAGLSGCDYRTLRRLNPSLVRGIVPTSTAGYALRLPLAHEEQLRHAIWGAGNLVVTYSLANLREERALAQVQGFSASNWLLGAHNVLNFDADEERTRIAGEWSRGWREIA